MTDRLNWSRIMNCAILAAVLMPALAWAQAGSQEARDRSTLAAYHAELAHLRNGRTSIVVPGPKFFLFGMGPRPKFIYRSGELIAWPSGRVIRRWQLQHETIIAPSYAVSLATSSGPVRIFEDESGLFLQQGGRRTTLAAERIHLPDFAGERYPKVLRVLHQEILINIVNRKPVPNFLVYSKPWHRDGAMMAMVLRRTGNLGLIRDWVMSLRDPFDHNNAGKSEPDNLGEVLYLISCVSDRTHPLVPAILAQVEQFRKGNYIVGETDFAEHPVYQTKWLKFGLKALGLPHDRFVVPKVNDSYASLFWWDFRDGQIGPEFPAADAANYPYLAWARDHLNGGHAGPVAAGDYPLTWETEASAASYPGMSIISGEFLSGRTAAPHTWHAAEMFLMLASDKDEF